MSLRLHTPQLPNTSVSSWALLYSSCLEAKLQQICPRPSDSRMNQNHLISCDWETKSHSETPAQYNQLSASPARTEWEG